LADIPFQMDLCFTFEQLTKRTCVGNMKSLHPS
jgi:hypothetical protein